MIEIKFIIEETAVKVAGENLVKVAYTAPSNYEEATTEERVAAGEIVEVVRRLQEHRASDHGNSLVATGKEASEMLNRFLTSETLRQTNQEEAK